MQAINAVKVFGRACPICLDPDILPETITTADPSQTMGNVLVLPCGHPVHVSCFHNCDSVHRVEHCFTCRHPIKRNWIPRDQQAAAQIYQAWYDKSPTLMGYVTLSLAAITLITGSITYSGTVADVVAAASSATISLTIATDTVSENPHMEHSSTIAVALLTSGLAAIILSVSEAAFKLDEIDGGAVASAASTALISSAICISGVISAYRAGRILGEWKPVRCLVGSLAIAHLVAIRALLFVGDGCRRSLFWQRLDRSLAIVHLMAIRALLFVGEAGRRSLFWQEEE